MPKFIEPLTGFAIMGIVLALSLVYLASKLIPLFRDPAFTSSQKKQIDTLVGAVAVSAILFGFLCGVFPYWSAGMQNSQPVNTPASFGNESPPKDR